MTARLRGLGAALALLGLVIGLPLLLVALGPVTLPGSWQAAASGLLRPDDGTLALAAIKILAWAVWVVLTLTVAVEVIARARRIPPPSLRGLGRPQLAIRDLVAAAVLLFVAAPAVSHVTPASAQPVTVHAVEAGQASTRAAVREKAESPSQGTVEHVVTKGESLWRIAEKHLGDGERYPEIVELNRPLLGDKPGFLRTGWTLRLPLPDHDGQPAAAHAGRYVVRQGDTLSEIALDELGDARAYPRIAKASRDIEQPGGGHLTDPDRIDVGWTLQIPAPTGRDHTEPEQVEKPASKKADTETLEPGTHPASAETAAPVPADTAAAQPTPIQATKPTPSSATPQPVTPTQTLDNATPTPPVTEPSAVSTTGTAPSVSQLDEAEDSTSWSPTWLLSGLTGGGALLAAGMLVWLRRARAAQRRERRPGRTISLPPTGLAPVEKTLIAAGGPALPTLELVDQALRRLIPGATGRMPQIAAIEIGDRLTLHLAGPGDLPSPWQPMPDSNHWSVPADIDLDQLGTPTEPDAEAPYPQLAVIGTGDNGATWLLNLEELGTVAITGDATYAGDLARGIAAEIAINPWTRDVRLDSIGIAPEAATLNPARARHHTTLGGMAGEVVADAVHIADRLTDVGVPDIATARATSASDDLWESRLLIVDAEHADDTLHTLAQLLTEQPGRTGAALIVVGPSTVPARYQLELTSTGRVRFPEVGLDLTSAGLTGDEAHGCASLIAAADDLDDQPIPVDLESAEGWRALTDQAGALREELTIGRGELTAAPSHSLLEAPDREYTAIAATTSEDLAALAPQVTESFHQQVEDADPTLDTHLDLWFSDHDALPRLWLLGPVRGRTGSGGDPTALLKRKAHTLELAAYLATRPNGATTNDVADAFGVAPGQVRKDMAVLRRWLGTDPRTGRPHIPDATTTPAAKARGIGVYQLDDVLVDADLFRRLRARGQARGPEGIADLRSALALVTGIPFSELRTDGGAWLTDGDRLDQHLLCAIVDVAHIVTTDALHSGDLATARAAAQIARDAAPDEETPRLDLAAVAAAEGNHTEAEHIAREICRRSDTEDGAPSDLPQRTDQLLRHHAWLSRRRTAS